MRWEKGGEKVSCKGGRWCGHEGEVSKKEAWERHELLRRVTTPTFTHTPVTFDAVVVQCFCHGGQSLLTIGDQLEKTDVHIEKLASYHDPLT